MVRSPARPQAEPAWRSPADGVGNSHGVTAERRATLSIAPGAQTGEDTGCLSARIAFEETP